MDTPYRKRRQQQRAIDTRERILDAAGRVFLEKGYEGASIADFIFAADTTKGAFYGHFKGKLEVAKAIMADTFSLDGLEPQAIKLQEVVDVGTILAHRVVNEDALLAALTLSFHHNARDIYGTPWPDWIKFNVDQLEKAKKRNEVRPHIISEEHAFQIAGAWSGLVFTGRAVDGGLGNFQERVSIMYKSLMAVIAQPEILPFVNFSESRGERLYAAFLESRPMKASGDDTP